MTKYAHQESQFARPASGNPCADRSLVAQYRTASIQQRIKERKAFNRTFMEWVDGQIRMRGISRRELAGRCNLPVGTVTTHFKHPERVNSGYLVTYLHGLGVRLTFQCVPVQFIEEIPNIEF